MLLTPKDEEEHELAFSAAKTLFGRLRTFLNKDMSFAHYRELLRRETEMGESVTHSAGFQKFKLWSAWANDVYEVGVKLKEARTAGRHARRRITWLPMCALLIMHAASVSLELRPPSKGKKTSDKKKINSKTKCVTFQTLSNKCKMTDFGPGAARNTDTPPTFEDAVEFSQVFIRAPPEEAGPVGVILWEQDGKDDHQPMWHKVVSLDIYAFVGLKMQQGDHRVLQHL